MLVFEVEVNGKKEIYYKKCDPVVITLVDIDDENKRFSFFGEGDRDAYEAAVSRVDDLYAFNAAYDKYEKNEVAFNSNYGIGTNYDIKKEFIKSLSLEDLKRYIRMSGYKVITKRTGISVRLDKAKTKDELEAQL